MMFHLLSPHLRKRRRHTSHHLLHLFSLSLLLLLCCSAVRAQPSLPALLQAVNQSVTVSARVPTLITLSYLSSLLQSEPLSSPPSSLPVFSISPLGFTSSSPLDPVTCVLTSLPSASSLISLYDNDSGQRGALIMSVPHALSSLSVFLVSSSLQPSAQQAGFSFLVQSSTANSSEALVNVSVAATYFPPSFPSPAVTLATLSEANASAPAFLSLPSLAAVFPSASQSLSFMLTAFPQYGSVYAVNESVLSQLTSAASSPAGCALSPFLPTPSPLSPQSFSAPASTSPSCTSPAELTALSTALAAFELTAPSAWSSASAFFTAPYLVYLPSAGSASSDSLAFTVDDSVSTLPASPLSVGIESLPVVSSVYSVNRSLSTGAFTPVTHTLPCNTTAAAITACSCTALTLPANGQVMTGGVVVTATPAVITDCQLTFTPYDRSLNRSVEAVAGAGTGQLQYVVWSGLQVSSVYSLIIAVQPQLSPPSSVSFAVNSPDWSEALVQPPVWSAYDNNSFQLVVTSLPDAAVGTLLLADGSRDPLPAVPAALPFAASPSLIFSPALTATAGATAFSYYVKDSVAQLSSASYSVSVTVGTQPSPASTQSVAAFTTQVDPVVITLSAFSSLPSVPPVVAVTSLPQYGTLYQYSPLPAFFFSISSLLSSTFVTSPSWSADDSPTLMSSASSPYYQTLNNVSQLVNVDCLSAAVSCLPDALTAELIPLSNDSLVTDPLLRLLYVPARFAAASDVFTFAAVGSSVSSEVVLSIASLPSPPVPAAYATEAPYLPTLPSFSFGVYADSDLTIELRAASPAPAAGASSVQLFLSRLPSPSLGHLYYDNAENFTWTPVPALQPGDGNATLPWLCPAPYTLLYRPSGAMGNSELDFAYASFDFFAYDGALASAPQTVTISLLPTVVYPICTAPPTVSATRGSDVILTFAVGVPAGLQVLVQSLPAEGLLYQTTVAGLPLLPVVSASTFVQDSLLKLLYRPYLSPSATSDSFLFSVYNATSGLLSLPCEVSLTLSTPVTLPVATSFSLSTSEISTSEKTPVSFYLGCEAPTAAAAAECVFELVTLPGAGSLSLGNVSNSSVVSSLGLLLPASQQLSFTPGQFEHGNPLYYNYYANFSYVAYANSSSALASLPALVTIAVLQVNYPPTLADQLYSMEEDGYVVIDLAAVEPDPTLAYTIYIASLPGNGTLYQYDGQNPTNPIGAAIGFASGWAVQELDTNGEPGTGHHVVFVPAPYTHGVNYSSFSYYAADISQLAGLSTAPALVTISVEKRNHAPTLSSVSFIISGESDSWLDLYGSAYDVDGDEVVYSILTWPQKGSLYVCQAETPHGSGQCDTDLLQQLTPQDLSPLRLLTCNGSAPLSIPWLFATYANVLNSSLLLSLDGQGAFYPFLNFTFAAFDPYLLYSTGTITVTLQCTPGLVPNIWSQGAACTDCPTGAQCSTDGTYLPYPYDGYYAMHTSDSLVFVPCVPASACGGGYDASCNTGYSGLLCGACVPGYVRMDTECFACPSGLLWLSAFVVTLSSCALLLLVLLLSRHRVSFSSVFILLVFLQTLAVYNNFHLQWPNAVSLLFTALSLAAFNVDLFAVSCYITSASYYHKWAGTLLLLPGVLATIAAVYGLAMAAAWLRYRRTQRAWLQLEEDRHVLTSLHSAFHAAVAAHSSSLLRSMTKFLLASFLPLAAKAFQLFNCSRLPDGSVLFNPDSSLFCTDSWYAELLPWCILFLCVYPLFVLIWIGGGVSKNVPRRISWGKRRYGLWWWGWKVSAAQTAAAGGRPKERPVQVAGAAKQGRAEQQQKAITFSVTSSAASATPLVNATSVSSSSSCLVSPTSASSSSFHALHSPSSLSSSASSSSHRRARLNVMDASFSFLTSPFRPLYFYWYLVVLLRLFLLAVCCMIYPDVPIAGATFALTILLLSALLQCTLQPYLASSLNRLELITLLSAALVLFCGVIFKGDTSSSPSPSPLTSLFIAFIFLTLAVVLSYATFVYWRKVEKLLFCRRCRRVPLLRVKSEELMMRVGRRLRERVKERRDMAVLRRRGRGDMERERAERAEMVRRALSTQLQQQQEARRDDSKDAQKQHNAPASEPFNALPIAGAGSSRTLTPLPPPALLVHELSVSSASDSSSSLAAGEAEAGARDDLRTEFVIRSGAAGVDDSETEPSNCVWNDDAEADSPSSSSSSSSLSASLPPHLLDVLHSRV